MLKNIELESPYLIPEGRENIKNFLSEIPKGPGVYKFLDSSKNHLYIGKAKYLNKRVASYFRTSSRSEKIDKLFELAVYIELSLTNTELESLLQEQFLIKEYKPKFNVQFKDDKGYPWIKIDTKNRFPSAKSFLGKKDEKSKFFGPFPNSYAVRDALKLVQKTFRLRNCSESYFKNRTRPCLQYEIGRCSAPCVGLISFEEYQKEAEGADLLLTGQSEKLISEFYNLMDAFSAEKEFEKAAIYRDRISALREIQRSQSIAGFGKNRDAIYLSRVKGKTKVGVSSVNRGWLIGHKNYVLEEGFEDDEILERFISHNYLSANKCPPVLVLGKKIQNKQLLENALSSFHSKKVKIISRPTKKDKGLLDICRANTEFVLKKDKVDIDIDLKIDALKKELKINDEIEIIESYDISHHSGQNAVAGCVVYSKEGKAKNLYRSYNISKENSGNDIGSMLELVDRRFSSPKENKVPNLLIIDGGRVHLNSVANRMRELGLLNTRVISISKGVRRKASFDSIHLQQGETLLVREGSVFHRFIQEIRDETHRYAISRQKIRRAKSSLISSIETLDGIGSRRKKILLRYFGSLEQIKRASIDDLSEVNGIGKITAKSIYKQLHN